MLIDPVVVPAGTSHGEAKMLVIRTDGYGSERVREEALNMGLITQHQKGKTGDRHYLKFSQTLNSEDPITGKTVPQTATVSISITKPAFGFTDANIISLYELLTDYVASDDVTLDRILAFQS